MNTNDLDEKFEERDVQNDVMAELSERTVRAFLDLFILRKLGESSEPLSGYDFIGLIFDEFGITVSPGSIYSVLYSMERDGLIRGLSYQWKRVYVLTDNGEKKIKTVSGKKEKVLNLFGSLFLSSWVVG